jgi:tetratricopeptide (TPR) repeat protein
MDKTSSGELAGIGDLLTNAWEIYKERMLTLILVGLATVVLPIVSFAPLFALGYAISQFMPDFKMVIVVISTLLAVVVMVWVANWAVSAFLTAIVDEQCGIKEAFQKAKPKVIAHIWLGTLTGLILTGAHLLLIIPGIIFTVWFFFSPFVFIDEDVRGMDALLKSKEYVRGRWLGVCWRLLAIWLISALVSTIPIIGQLLALFLIPFSFVYTFLVFQDLRETRGDISFQPTRKEKATIIATGTFGYVMPVLLVFAFMGSMLLMPFSMLKAKMTGQSPFPIVTEEGKAQGSVMETTRVQIAPAVPGVTTNLKSHIQTLEDKSTDWAKRSQAAFNLGQSRDKNAIEPLVRALGKDQHWAVRQNAADSLSRLRAQQAVPTLIHALESDKNVFVRTAAAKALGKLGDRRAVEALKKALEDQETVTTLKDGKTVAVKEVAEAAREALKLFAAPEGQGSSVTASKGSPATGPGQGEKKGLTSGTRPSQDMKKAEGSGEKQAGNLRQNIEACTKALKLQPKDALAYHNRAVANFRLGNYQEAVDDFTSAIEFDPKNATAYYNRAIAYGSLGRHKQAIEDGIKAIELNPKEAKAYINRGIDYIVLGNCNLAVDDFNTAIELNAQDASAYYARGVAYHKLGSHKEALRDFKKAAELGDKNAQEYVKSQGATAESHSIADRHGTPS